MQRGRCKPPEEKKSSGLLLRIILGTKFISSDIFFHLALDQANDMKQDYFERGL